MTVEAAVMGEENATNEVKECNRSFTWNLRTYERQGRLFVEWGTNAPFRAREGWICVYEGNSFPANPNDNKKTWQWDDSRQPWDTGLTFGKGWHVASIGQDSHGNWRYICQIVT